MKTQPLLSIAALSLCLALPALSQPAGNLEESAGVTTGALPVTTLNGEQEIANPLTQIHDPTAAWIKRSDFLEGSMLSGFTVLEEGPGGFGSGVAASTQTGGLWINAPSYAARRWFETPAWPAPSNFCDLYPCPQVAWAGYTYVAQTLWTGINDVAVLVVTGGVTNPYEYDEIALVSSVDGGATFSKSKLITLTEESATNIDPKSIYASVHRDPQVGTLVDGKRERAIYLVWKNRHWSDFETRWWTTKVLFGVDGTFIQPDKPRLLAIVPEHAERVTIQSYFFDNYADDHFVDVAYAELLDEEGNPTSRPSCPSEKTVTVKWWLTRTPNYNSSIMDWYCHEANGNLPCIDRKNLLSQDDRWRPCVGSGFSTNGNPWTQNDERVSYTYNESFPRTWFAGITRSDEHQAGRMRVHLYEAHYDTTNGTPLQTWVLDHITAGPLDEDHYGQQQAMHKGTGWPADVPMLAYSFFVTDDKNRTRIDATTAPAPSSLSVDPWTPGTAPLTGLSWSVQSDVGTKHGLTVQQVCVDDSEGPCGGVPALWPDFRFFAAWPMIPELDAELWGRAFTD